jgi:hypothetical protein
VRARGYGDGESANVQAFGNVLYGIPHFQHLSIIKSWHDTIHRARRWQELCSLQSTVDHMRLWSPTASRFTTGDKVD